jgi:hypothetical protein
MQEVLRRRRAFLMAMAELLRRRRAITAVLQTLPHPDPSIAGEYPCKTDLPSMLFNVHGISTIDLPLGQDA